MTHPKKGRFREGILAFSGVYTRLFAHKKDGLDIFILGDIKTVSEDRLWGL